MSKFVNERMTKALHRKEFVRLVNLYLGQHSLLLS